MEDKLTIRAIQSYDGLTFAFDSKTYYDIFTLYERIGDENHLILTTKDCIASDKSLKEGHTYYVAGYKNEGEAYNLKEISEPQVCVPIVKEELTTKPLISVVCPVYKAETCIANCIDSLLLSTQEGIEFIFIDDGSPDRSGEVIQWYQEHYPTLIKYYKQENQGVSFARNKGIELAEGEFIGLIDNDDFVHPRMYEELLRAARETSSDIAIGKTIIKAPTGEESVVLDVPNEENKKYITMNYDEMMTLKNKCDIHNIFFVAVWHKIIKADLVKAHHFPNSNHYEDTAYTRMIYSYIDQFSFAFDAYYIWDQRRRNTVGTASTYNYNRQTDDIYEIHKKFFSANFYGIEAGNKERRDWISYDIIKEVYDYLKKSNCLEKENDLRVEVEKRIKDHFLLVYLKTNKHIKEDSEILQFINEIED